MLASILDRIVHDSALASLGCLHNLACLVLLQLLSLRSILLLEDASSSVLDSLWLVVILLRLVILVFLLLTSFATVGIVVVLVVISLALLIIFGGCNHISLLLHSVGLLAFAGNGLGAFASYAPELLVALDELIKRLIVHCIVHSNQV